MTDLLNLENRIKELENKLGEFLKKNNLFGRSYSQAGSSNSDFLIKTKGQVKILWGTKFIDLIKDGKINAESSFIFKVKDYNSIGVRDGIYILNDESIYLKTGNNIISLVGDIGNTYVSFMKEQETDANSKYTALTNIGFLYSDIDKVDANSLLNGIIYIESELKLYIVLNGILTKFSADFPNPYNLQFILEKNNSDKGALYIKGEGIENSLAFTLLYIYNEFGTSYIKSQGDIVFKIDLNNKAILSFQSANFLTDEVICKMFKSSGAANDKGFRLYLDNNNTSTLEIDNLIVRNEGLTSEFIHPEYWYYNTNIISSIKPYYEEDIKYKINLKYENTYTEDECIYILIEYRTDEEISKLQKVPFIVKRIEDNAIFVSEILEEPIDENIILSVKNSTIFSIGNKGPIKILRRNSDSLDIIELNKISENLEESNEESDITNFSDEQNVKSVITRVGKISDLDLSIKVDELEELYNKDYGIFSTDGIFLNAAYKSDYQLDGNDNSSRFASTEWVKKYFNSLMPAGVIIMWALEEIPEGWAICDGTNGTPNLVGSFIKASNTAGQTGGSSTITIEELNLPSHTHDLSGTITTSVDGSHTHTIAGLLGTSENSDAKNVIEIGSETDIIETSSNGEHSHTINLSEVSLGSTGLNTPINYEPVYYSLIFIMKIDTQNNEETLPES